ASVHVLAERHLALLHRALTHGELLLGERDPPFLTTLERLARTIARVAPIAGALRDVVGPTATQVGLDLLERTSLVLGIHSGHVAQLIRRPRGVVLSVARRLGESLPIVVVVRPIHVVRRINRGSAGPPATRRAGD